MIMMVVPAPAAGLADSAWPKSGYDLSNTGQSPYAGPQSNSTAWTYTTGGSFYFGGPVIGQDGTIYMSITDKNVYGLYPNGTLRWTYDTGASCYNAPAIDSNGIIYGVNDDKKLYAVNPDGTQKWEYTTGESMSGSPAIGSDGTLYVGSTAGNLFAIHPDGTYWWTFSPGGAFYYGTPAIGQDGTIYAGNYDKNLYAVNPDGSLKWSYETGESIENSPAIAADGTIYVGCDDCKLYAINPDGTLKWEYTTGGYLLGAPSVAADGTIYIGSYDNKLYAINPDGTFKWAYDADNLFYYTSPSVGSDGTVYIGDEGGKVYAVNPDGTLKWEYTTGGGIYNSAAIGPDGTLYIGSYDKKLYAFRDAAEFSAGPKMGGAPLTVQFTDESTGSPDSWLWDFGDGNDTNATLRNPLHTYQAAGNYSVNLTVTDAYGRSYSKEKIGYINVTNSSSGEVAPIPGFTTDASSGRVPFTVHFTDTTTGNVTGWSWDFGDGGTSTGQNPVHTYVTEGTYTVTLTATGPGGTDTATATVEVAAPLNTGSASGGVPLLTVQEGNVSGGLWYDSWPGFAQSAEKTFTLPAHTEIKWARLYADVYCGFMTENMSFSMTMDIDADGDGIYELQKQEAGSVVYSDTPAWVNDHVVRVTSDYLMWYDLTDEINGTEVNVRATGGGDDGRIKHITLVVAYDDDDGDVIRYWVNQGHDTANTDSDTGSTEFETSALSGADEMTLSSIFCASVDGVYTFNGAALTSGGSTGDYFGCRDWDVSGHFIPDQDSTLTYAHAASAYYKIQLALLTASGAVASNAPNAEFSANVTSGPAPLTVRFTDESTGSPDSWSWNFGDGETSDEQNPVHTFSDAGEYTVSLTATNGYGSNTEEKTGYISLSQNGTDIGITNSVVPLVGSAVFAREPNTVRILYLKNGGNEALTNITIDLYASDASGPVDRTTIASLGSGAQVQVQMTDPTIREFEGGIVSYTAVVDPDNTIAEIDENNNNMSSVKNPVKYNGYKGKGIYWEGGSNITTKHTYDLNGGMVYYTQLSSYSPVDWSGRTETWTKDNLPVPDGATIEEALLFVSYNWDQTPSGLPDWTTTFNGNPLEITPGQPYTDKSNFGGYSNYMYGLYVVNVTDYFNPDANTFMMTPKGDNKNALYPSTLVVIYNDSSASRKQIFINEECDELGASLANYGTTPEEATAYAPFTGMEINVGSVKEATLYSFAGSAGSDGGEGNLFFNGDLVASAWPGDDWSSIPLIADVKSCLAASGNEAGVQGTKAGGMCAYQQILVVEYGIVPQANFTASPVEGKIPFEVNFTDRSDYAPLNWSWKFGDGGTSEMQNPSHIYTFPGIYSVSLTVSNPNGSTTCIAAGLVNATLSNAPVARFSADVIMGLSPLQVQFTDESTNNPGNWAWDFGDGNTSAEQNPSHLYTSTGLYTVNLTASNSDGNDTATKPGYIEVVGTSVLSDYNDINIQTANDGIYDIGNCSKGEGLSDLHISSDPESPAGDVNSTDSLAGTFYVTCTGGDRGFQDNIILMLAVNGTIPETFDVDITASGYNWTPSDLAEKPRIENITYRSASIHEIFTKDDFIYGPQKWKPTGGNPDYPIFAGEDMYDSGNMFRIMFIDLKSGVLGVDYALTAGNGSVKVDYAFTNLTTYAAFNVYGWNLNNSKGEPGIIDTNSISSGYSVFVRPPSENGGLVTDFEADNTSGQAPMTVTFTDLTAGGPTGRLWHFGDGGTSTDPTPSHTYNMPGTYSVNLTTSNSEGSNSTLKVNYINVAGDLPAAGFTADKTSGQVPLTVHFTDTSTGDVTDWKWDFDNDGTIDSTVRNPSYDYTATGKYSVNLTVTNIYGTDSVLKQNYITVSPKSSSTGGSSSGDSSSSDTVTTSRGRLDYKNSENPNEVQSSGEGKVLADTGIPSRDGSAIIVISKGTVALDKSGEAIDRITIENVDEGSVPENDDSGVFEFTGKAYECSPSGATFSPAIDLVFTFTADEWKQFDGTTPSVMYYNTKTKDWEEVETTYDPETMTVTASITHFSKYAVFAKTSGAAVTSAATEESVHSETPEVARDSPESGSEGSSPASNAILGLFAVGLVGICSFGAYKFKLSRNGKELFREK